MFDTSKQWFIILFFSHPITVKLIRELLNDEVIILKGRVGCHYCLFMQTLLRGYYNLGTLLNMLWETNMYKDMVHSTSKTLVADFTVLRISILYRLQFVTHGTMLFICKNN